MVPSPLGVTEKLDNTIAVLLSKGAASSSLHDDTIKPAINRAPSPFFIKFIICLFICLLSFYCILIKSYLHSKPP